MSSKSKQKGYKFEKEIERRFLVEGFRATRAGQPHQPDIVVDGLGRIEAKCEKSLKGIYDRKGEADYLFLKWQSPAARSKDILVVMTMERFFLLLFRAGHE